MGRKGGEERKRKEAISEAELDEERGETVVEGVGLISGQIMTISSRVRNFSIFYTLYAWWIFYRYAFWDLSRNLPRNGLWRMREGVGFNTELVRGGFLGN